MSHQRNLWDTTSTISSPELVSGPTLSGAWDGPTTDPSGQEVARASLSARQAKEAGLLTIATSGPPGSGLSASADLAWFLVNRLRPVTASLGSTLFRLTWKERVTPLGRSISALRASGRRTSGSGFSSWPTPAATQLGNTLENYLAMKANMTSGPRRAVTELGIAATLASWATPRGEDSECAGAHRGVADGLHSQADLAGWASPAARDIKGPNSEEHTESVGHNRHMVQLPNQAQLAGWATPVANDDNKTPEAHLRMKKRMGERDGTGANRTAITSLQVQAQLTASGETPSGSPAVTEKRGQLNPALSRWLMGLPPEWDGCGVTAMPSSRRSRKRS